MHKKWVSPVALKSVLDHSSPAKHVELYRSYLRGPNLYEISYIQTLQVHSSSFSPNATLGTINSNNIELIITLSNNQKKTRRYHLLVLEIWWSLCCHGHFGLQISNVWSNPVEEFGAFYVLLPCCLHCEWVTKCPELAAKFAICRNITCFLSFHVLHWTWNVLLVLVFSSIAAFWNQQRSLLHLLITWNVTSLS